LNDPSTSNNDIEVIKNKQKILENLFETDALDNFLHNTLEQKENSISKND